MSIDKLLALLPRLQGRDTPSNHASLATCLSKAVAGWLLVIVAITATRGRCAGNFAPSTRRLLLLLLLLLLTARLRPMLGSKAALNVAATAKPSRNMRGWLQDLVQQTEKRHIRSLEAAPLPVA
jgi:hypothetical protein